MPSLVTPYPPERRERLEQNRRKCATADSPLRHRARLDDRDSGGRSAHGPPVRCDADHAGGVSGGHPVRRATHRARHRTLRRRTFARRLRHRSRTHPDPRRHPGTAVRGRGTHRERARDHRHDHQRRPRRGRRPRDRRPGQNQRRRYPRRSGADRCPGRGAHQRGHRRTAALQLHRATTRRRRLRTVEPNTADRRHHTVGFRVRPGAGEHHRRRGGPHRRLVPRDVAGHPPPHHPVGRGSRSHARADGFIPGNGHRRGRFQRHLRPPSVS